jgi:hypothetical protein
MEKIRHHLFTYVCSFEHLLLGRTQMLGAYLFQLAKHLRLTDQFARFESIDCPGWYHRNRHYSRHLVRIPLTESDQKVLLHFYPLLYSFPVLADIQFSRISNPTPRVESVTISLPSIIQRNNYDSPIPVAQIWAVNDYPGLFHPH